MLSALVIATLVQVSAPPQQLAPGTRYDPAIPTLEGVVGHDFGESVTPPDQIIRYMEALARAAPDRTQLIRYAESWEGRPLVVLVIGSSERMARLDEIKADLASLADPRGLSDEESQALLDAPAAGGQQGEVRAVPCRGWPASLLVCAEGTQQE